MFFTFVLSGNCQDKSTTIALKKNIDKIQVEHNVIFNYLEDDITNIKLVPPSDLISLTEKLDYISLKTHLHFNFVSKKYIAISSSKKLQQTFCGYLIDEQSKEVITSANIGYKGTLIGTTSNEKGFFELPIVAFHEIEISHINYGKTTILLEKLSENCLTIELKSTTNELNEVFTSTIFTRGIQKKIDGSFEIKPKKFGILPGLTESDVFSTMQNLPGINSADESTSNINVRGGSHDQNLYLWNGIRLFQTGHFFGLISALNPNLANTIKIYKNGSPANYGESVSSIVDISTHHKDTLNSSSIGLNMINVDFNSTFKPGKKSSLTLSGRRSFTDLFNSPTYKKYNAKIFQNTVITSIDNNENALYETDEKFYFYDATVQFQQKIGNRSEMFIDAITIANTLKLIQEKNENNTTISKKSSLDHQTLGGSISFKTNWNSKNNSEFNFYTSQYHVNSENESINNNQILKQENTILDIGFKFKFNHKINKNTSVNFGYQFNEVGVTNFDKINTPVFTRKIKEILNSNGLLSEINYRSENEKLNTTLGVRQNYIQQFKKYLFEPRLQFNYALSSHLKIEVLGEFKSQTSSQIIDLQNDFLGIEKHRWVLANNEDYPIIRSKQVSVGITYKKKNWLLSVDNFYKKVSGINSKSQGFQNQLEFLNKFGSYTSYGSEILIQKQMATVTAWITYTYTLNNYNFENFSPAVFPNNYEIQHNINLGIIYDYKNLKLAIGTHWHSGKPITKPLYSVPIYNTNNQPEIVYEKPNSSKLPDYLQVNFSAGYNFSIYRKMKLQFGIAVQNMLNKNNIINQFYKINTTSNQIEQVNTYSLQRTPNAFVRLNF